MTKDKKYIEYLLRNYKKKKSRLRILNLGLINEDDNILNGIDYSKDKIQTSNLTSLDDAIIKREEEIKRLEYEINIVEALLDSLDSRKDNQYRQLVENFIYYPENFERFGTWNEEGESALHLKRYSFVKTIV